MFEPSADARVIANTVFNIYMAYIQEGFTPEQALELSKAHILAASTS